MVLNDCLFLRNKIIINSYMKIFSKTAFLINNIHSFTKKNNLFKNIEKVIIAIIYYNLL